MALEQIKIYQINLAIANLEGVTADTTLGQLKTILLGDKEKTCPQCAGSGTLDLDFDSVKDAVCPTCEGDGKTKVQFMIDLPNSVLKYKPA